MTTDLRCGRPPVPAALALLAAARQECAVAGATDRPADRYVAAHLAALRAAASVVADRARPAGSRHRPTSVWALLAGVAPELAEWATYFAAGAGKRAAAEAGLGSVSAREADDLLRAAGTFVDLAAEVLTRPTGLPFDVLPADRRARPA
jgi:hypothetical protein